MTDTYISPLDTTLDLVIERDIDVPVELVWRGLTEAALVKKWFSPHPWQTADCRIDLRVGGEFYTVMQSPEGEKFPGASCFLEIVPHKRIVWTSTLQPGFRPAAPLGEHSKACDALSLTCIVTLEKKADGTHYKAHVLHGSPQQMKAHEEMGFHEGWGTCLTQLVDVVKGL